MNLRRKQGIALVLGVAISVGAHAGSKTITDRVWVGDNVDSHSYSVSSNNWLEVAVSGDGDSRLLLYVHGPSRGASMRMAVPADEAAMAFQVGAGGTYQIDVINRDDEMSPYTLTIRDY